MAYEEKEYKKSGYENDWALDIKSNYIHIDNAKSGAKGYYCIGCGKEMQGVKFTNPKYQSYFRHQANNIDQEKVECVVASKVYRERLAESILNRLKFVNAPVLYKYPPKGVEGSPMLLKKRETIIASYTKAQEWFYEDEDGTIKWGKNPQVEDRYLLIRPDVTFFDVNNNPILFIEFVITHKLDIEKLTKLSRIGIDTLQIIIPKVPEEQIEEALKSSRKYKWVYNELEANTTYISIPQGNTEGVPPIDEQQRKLFEESYACRAAKINNLVRDINKCLRSEPYRRAERLFESELSRVAKNRKTAGQRLGELEEQHRAEALERNQNIEDGIRKAQNEFEENFRTEEKELVRKIKSAEYRLGDLEATNRKDALSRNRDEEETIEYKYTDLEGRYFDKDRELEQGMRDYLSAQHIGIPIKRDIESAEKMVWKLERDANHLEQEITERFRTKFEYVENEIRRVEEEQRNLEKTIQSEIDSEIESTERSIRNIREYQSRIENEIWEQFKNEIEFEDSEIERITREESEFEKTIRDEFLRELKQSPSELPRRIKVIMDAERLGSTFSEAQREEKRYKSAREFFKKRTWEKR